MATLKAKDLRSLSVEELDDKVQALKKDLFQLRFDTKLAKIENVMKAKQVRREIAKALTVKREMELPPALRADRPGGKKNG